MKFPDHKTRIIPRKLHKQPPQKKTQRKTHPCAALHVGVRCMSKEVPFTLRKKLTSRVSFSTHVSNLPMSLHEMRPVLVPFVAPAGAMRNEKVVTYFFQKSCT